MRKIFKLDQIKVQKEYNRADLHTFTDMSRFPSLLEWRNVAQSLGNDGLWRMSQSPRQRKEKLKWKHRRSPFLAHNGHVTPAEGNEELRGFLKLGKRTTKTKNKQTKKHLHGLTRLQNISSMFSVRHTPLQHSPSLSPLPFLPRLHRSAEQGIWIPSLLLSVTQSSRE